ncbi:MAG: tRNA epoxyqueuosine(34) reductase QueG [Planctomycetota bacterium]
MDPRSLVLELAREAGFDLAGVAPLAPPPDAGRFEAWLAAGHHGDMAWLQQDRARITDPRRIDPRGRSLLVVGLAHSRAAVELPGGGRIARYAAGRDYHNVVQKRLRGLAKRLRRAGLGLPGRTVVDAGPLMERSHAFAAGVGFPSKAANLLHPAFGPFFFLGEVLLDLDLEPTRDSLPAGSCGTCTACIDACPTQAIVAPGVVDARRCISYHTIESRAPVPMELRPALGPWAFGCDVCSEVCPWTSRAPDLAARFGDHQGLRDAHERGIVSLLSLATDAAADSAAQEERFRARFEGSSLRRPGREVVARSAALALGNVPSDEGRVALLAALSDDPAALVREAAGWALARGHANDAGARAAVERAAAAERAPWARAALRAHLAGPA